MGAAVKNFGTRGGKHADVSPILQGGGPICLAFWLGYVGDEPSHQQGAGGFPLLGLWPPPHKCDGV